MLAMAADWTSALDRARAHAPFLARALERRPQLAELLAAGDGEEALLAAKKVEAADVATALRRERWPWCWPWATLRVHSISTR